MAEQENITLIQEIYAAFGRGDISSILANLSDDVEWTLETTGAIPFAGEQQGLDEVTQFFEALSSTLENMTLTTDEYIAQGDRVAAVGRFGAVVKANGNLIDTPHAHVFTIRGGKIARFMDFTDTARITDAYQGRAAAAS